MKMTKFCSVHKKTNFSIQIFIRYLGGIEYLVNILEKRRIEMLGELRL